MHVKLQRKLAEQLDGVDLSQRRVGDVMDVPPRDARLLIAEGWASSAEPARRNSSHPRARDSADEKPPPRKSEKAKVQREKL